MTHFTISDLAKEFGVSPRTIRFYEEKGLINPRRTSGNQRSYTRSDRARLKLILRGKHLGFRLDEMEDILSLANVDLERTGQMKRAIEIGLSHLEKVNEQIEALVSLKGDLLNYGENILFHLRESGKAQEDWEERLKEERTDLEGLYEKVRKPSRSKQ